MTENNVSLPNQKEEDLLGRVPFASQLAAAILNAKTPGAFTIGICGGHGSGKSSMLKMIAAKVAEAMPEQQDGAGVVMRFRPWNAGNFEQMTSAFFAQLSEHISTSTEDEELLRIGQKMERYSSGLSMLKLVPGINPGVQIVSGALHQAGTSLQGTANANIRDLQRQKEEIIAALRKQTCRIVVVIDDVDRMMKDQVQHLFRMLDTLEDLPATVFLLAFDREALVKMLDTAREGSGRERLDNAIQVMFDLPPVTAGQLQEVMHHHISRMLAGYPDIRVDQEEWARIYPAGIAPYLESVHDVNRIISALTLKSALSQPETDFTVLAVLTVLQMKEPDVFAWLVRNRTLLQEAGEGLPAELVRELPELACHEAETVAKTLRLIMGELKENYDLYMLLVPAEAGMNRADAEAIMQTNDPQHIARVLKDLPRQKKAQFLLEVRRNLAACTPEQKAALLAGILQAAEEIVPRAEPEGISLSPYRNAVLAVRELLAENGGGKDSLARLLADSTPESMILLAEPLAEIPELKEAVTKRLGTLSAERPYGLLETPHAEVLCLLWKQLDPDGFEEHLQQVLKDPERFCRFVRLFIRRPSDERVIYWRVNENYRVFVSDEFMAARIEEIRNDPSFGDLEPAVQEDLAAFSLQQEEEKKTDITVGMVETRLLAWGIQRQTNKLSGRYASEK